MDEIELSRVQGPNLSFFFFVTFFFEINSFYTYKTFNLTT